jgi:Zn-dependent protease
MLRFRLGRIPVEVHPSHLLVAAFLAYSFVPQGPNGPLASGSTLLSLVIAGAIVVFVSILVHELGHALVAVAYGYRPQIQLAWLGGNTRPNATGPIPWHRDVLLTLAGPLAGFLLYIVGKQVLGFAHAAPLPVVFGLQMLVLANLWWSLLNLVPVVPLDGGRISMVVLTRAFGRKGMFLAMGIGAAVSLALAFWGMSTGDSWVGIFFALFGAQQVAQIFAALRAPPVSEEDPALRTLSEATAAMRAQELERATTLVRQVLAQDPPVHPELRSRAHHILGWIAIKQGEGRVALDHFSQVQGIQVEPAALAAAFSLIGDDERSLPLWELASQQTQDRTVLHEWGGALIRAGRAAQAKALPGVDLASAYACAERVLFLRERYSEAAEAALARVELRPSAEAAYDAACALARAGDREKAVGLLERARSLGFDDLTHAATDPDLASLHGHPRFDALLQSAQSASS